MTPDVRRSQFQDSSKLALPFSLLAGIFHPASMLDTTSQAVRADAPDPQIERDDWRQMCRGS